MDWDRHDPWTLRFVDPDVERQYRDAMSAPARQRLRVAIWLGAPLWVVAALLGPPLLQIPVLPLLTAAIVNVVIEVAILWWIRRARPLRTTWSAALILSTVAAVGIAVGLAPSGTFASVGAAALMTSAVTAVGLVRPAASVAAAIGLISAALFAVVIVAIGAPASSYFQLFLLIATMAMAYAGARYIESAERSGFAQRLLIADLNRRIDRLFRQYLSPDVAQVLLDDPARAELGGEVVEATVLFADLRGYTPFSERTAPTEVVAMLNRVFGAAVPAVFAEGGTIVQFMGDALMAIFNAPLRQPDHALRACRAALALQRAVSDAGADGQPRFRIGINTGPVLVGNIGGAEMRNFTALGDTTNVAARLQTYAQEGTVVLGQATYELVRHVADVRSRGSADLKGKSSPIPVFQLIGMRTA